MDEIEWRWKGWPAEVGGSRFLPISFTLVVGNRGTWWFLSHFSSCFKMFSTEEEQEEDGTLESRD